MPADETDIVDRRRSERTAEPIPADSGDVARHHVRADRSTVVRRRRGLAQRGGPDVRGPGHVGTTGPVANEGEPVPLTFVAATLNRYVVPFDNPANVSVVAVDANVVCATGKTPTNAVTT